MTKKEKMILAFLLGIVVLLGCGLGFLIRSLVSENQETVIEADEPVILITVTIPIEKPEEPIIAAETVTMNHNPVIEKDDFSADTPLTPEPNLSPAFTQWAIETKLKKVEYVFQMSILGKDISVAYGVDEATLEKTPGWLPTSAKPGEEGTCVVYGHRNKNHLRALEGVKAGEIIVVTLPNGKSYSYTVNSVRILEREEELHIPMTEGSSLILSTCYPFYYSGHAPKKMVVIAELERKGE